MPELTLRRHYFQPQAQITRIAIAQHLGAARVGAQVAANRAAAFCGKTQGEQKPRSRSRFLNALQHATRLHRDGEVGGIQRAHGPQAGEAQHDLLAGFIRCGAHHQPGIATLGHDADAQLSLMLRTQANDLADLLGMGGPHHCQGAAAHPTAPVCFPSTQVARTRLRQHVFNADNLAQCVQPSRLRHHGVGLSTAKLLSALADWACLKRSLTCSVQAMNKTTQSSTSTIAK